MTILTASCSLNPNSHSRVLAAVARGELATRDVAVDYIDLRDHDLPFCDGAGAYGHPAVVELTGRFKAADGMIVAAPIYNYAVSAATKNLIELTGGSWAEKTVGLLCAAGGSAASMAPMGLISSLMLDFRCVVAPRYVYATSGAFETDQGGAPTLSDPDVRERVAQLVDEVIRLATG